MALAGCHRGIKYTVFVFNFFFWLTGGAIFSLGVWMRTDHKLSWHVIFDHDDVAADHTEAYILITIGSVVMLISFFACIGALLENQCLLAGFFAFMFAIFSVLLTGGILTFVTTHSLPETVDTVLRKAETEYWNITAAKMVIDFVQLKFNCCSPASEPASHDVNSSSLSHRSRTSVCQHEKQFKSCINKAVVYYTDVQRTIAAVAVTIACVSLLGIVLSVALCLAVREQQQQRLLQEQEDDGDDSLPEKASHRPPLDDDKAGE